ncbi:MAG TPA: hypothetical protein VFL87_00080 [Thermoleophilaceae bacterium]|nr:hypothetical protein [Thermoleophilaceae bacterium]
MALAAIAALVVAITAVLLVPSGGGGDGRRAGKPSVTQRAGKPSMTQRAGKPRVTQRAASPRAASSRQPPSAAAAELKPCLDHWNSPGNPTQRVRFATAARTAAAGTPLDNKALVLVYRGAPINDVGVGIGGVNLAPGDCMVIHPAAIMFAFTNGFWHQVGYTSGEPDLAPLPAQAARSPNAIVNLSSGIVTLSSAA